MKSYLKFLNGFPSSKKHVGRTLLSDPEFKAGLFSSDVCDQILKVLNERNQKPSDLAKKLGESRASISQKLSGNSNIKLSTLFKLTEALDFTIALPKFESCSMDRFQLLLYQNLSNKNDLSSKQIANTANEATLTFQEPKISKVLNHVTLDNKNYKTLLSDA